MGIIIRRLCWPPLSVSAVTAPASGELQDTAVGKSVCASMEYSRPKHLNKMNSIATITFQSFPIKGPPFCQRRTCTSNSRDLFIQAVYCQLLFLALPISALCLHKIATFITHLPSHEMTAAHLFPPPSLSRNGSVNRLRTPPAALCKTWTESEQLPDLDSWLN